MRGADERQPAVEVPHRVGLPFEVQLGQAERGEAVGVVPQVPVRQRVDDPGAGVEQPTGVVERAVVHGGQAAYGQEAGPVHARAAGIRGERVGQPGHGTAGQDAGDADLGGEPVAAGGPGADRQRGQLAPADRHRLRVVAEQAFHARPQGYRLGPSSLRVGGEQRHDLLEQGPALGQVARLAGDLGQRE
ncbi:hypothetical protein [Micromonospora sp. M42]|uniref:hypothetical protein n=1 Tax=Micromonospora sp. M42 TaxID=457406 RepID=UPI0018DBDF23|nr:hypothetical protein [Micromonospora sp. M42]